MRTLSPEVAARQAIEREIVTKVVDDALAAGYGISINNGGDDDEIVNSRDREAILKELFATDEEYLYLHENGKKIGTIFLVYGNDGWDVICDYSSKLEEFLAGANEIADRYMDA